MTEAITIGQAAAFAGVTAKAIRHYHRLGLIDEPRRDGSGYRRYTTTDLLRLVQIRTLTGAGVPLAEIAHILDAEPDRFAAALVDAEQRLTERIDDLIARRDTLRRIAGGNRVLLPERARAFLERLPDLGLTADEVELCHEALVLVAAVAPESFDDYLSVVERASHDPEYVALIRRCWQAAAWEPDDPRIEALAAAVGEHLIAHPELQPALTGLEDRADGATREVLISHHRYDQHPSWARIEALLEEKLRAAAPPND